MDRIFIELYLDEDVSVLLADLLKARGFAVTTTQAASQVGRSDSEQLAYAVSQRRTLVTHNRADFEHLLLNTFPLKLAIAESSLLSDVRFMRLPNDC